MPGAPCLAGFARHGSFLGRRSRLHISPQDGVDASLVAALSPEPAQQVGVESHGHDGFQRGHDDLGIFPEGGVGGVGVRVREDTLANRSRAHAI